VKAVRTRKFGYFDDDDGDESIKLMFARSYKISHQRADDTLWGLITKKILRLSYDVIITYDNRKSNLR